MKPDLQEGLPIRGISWTLRMEAFKWILRVVRQLPCVRRGRRAASSLRSLTPSPLATPITQPLSQFTARLDVSSAAKA
jgi:hypothetical protein